MRIELTEADGLSTITLHGDINGRTAPQLEERLVPLIEPHARFVLDMTHVSYMSSAGLRLLLLLYRKIDRVSGRIVLACLPEMVHDTMAITGFLDFFDTYPTVALGQEAVAATP